MPALQISAQMLLTNACCMVLRLYLNAEGCQQQMKPSWEAATVCHAVITCGSCGARWFPRQSADEVFVHSLAVLSLSKGFWLMSSLWSCSVAGRRYESQPNASARLSQGRTFLISLCAMEGCGVQSNANLAADCNC